MPDPRIPITPHISGGLLGSGGSVAVVKINSGVGEVGKGWDFDPCPEFVGGSIESFYLVGEFGGFVGGGEKQIVSIALGFGEDGV